jgi:hypothetical protein
MIQRATLIRSLDYPKASPRANATVSIDSSERILRIELCDKFLERTLKKLLRYSIVLS